MTLSQAEQSLVGAPSTYRHDAAGPLYRVRAYIAQGYTFGAATARVQGEPGIAAQQQRLALLGSTIPVLLTDLSGP